jgi:D-alanine-D-alanine ligase
MKKLRVAVVFGGRSAEHEISLLSARNVVSSLDPSKYEAVLIGIDRQGRWLMGATSELGADEADGLERLLSGDGADTVRLDAATREVGLVSTGPTSALMTRDGGTVGHVDVLFPVLHGPYGEDGTIQGLAKLADIPCVGAGVLGSAVGMDKDVMKRLLRDAGIPIAPFRTITGRDRDTASYADLSSALGPRLYVKPANLGSSVGISRAADAASLRKAIDLAFKYDTKVIVEAEVTGREIECSVLGNEDPIASVPGEIVPSDGFYSYEAKYLDENGAELRIPADLTQAEQETVQGTSIKTFLTLCCEGMARVDGFLCEDGTYVVNEINTIPGFTRISMYPKLFEASGIGPSELIDRLVGLALERHERESGLSLSPLDE